MIYLITYDIVDNKKRKKISDELEGYGLRVNYSVFECELNKSKVKKLKSELEELMDKKTDSIRFYNICKNCMGKSFELNLKKGMFEEQEMYF